MPQSLVPYVAANDGEESLDAGVVEERIQVPMTIGSHDDLAGG